MADLYQTGVEPGDCLVSHPHWNPQERLLFVTEHHHKSTVALELNTPSEHTVDQLQMMNNTTVPLTDTVYLGGDFNTHSLVLLHDSNWYSSNTMPINSQWSITSDRVMLEKLEMGQTPDFYRVLLGISAWMPKEIDQELASSRPQWLVLKQPTWQLVMADCDEQYQLAIDELAQQQVDLLFN